MAAPVIPLPFRHLYPLTLPRAVRLATPVVLGATVILSASCQFATLELQYGVDFVEEGQVWDPASLQSVTTALSLLPPEARAQLGNPSLGPLHISSNYTGTSLTGWSPYGRGANYYTNHKGYNEVVLYPAQPVTTVLHEFGHAYQLRGVPPGRIAWVFLDAEFQDFMAATGWQVHSSREEIEAAREAYQVSFSYAGDNVWNNLSAFDPLEDYANSFAMFFADPERLRLLSPVRYDWMATRVGAAQPALVSR